MSHNPQAVWGQPSVADEVEALRRQMVPEPPPVAPPRLQNAQVRVEEQIYLSEGGEATVLLNLSSVLVGFVWSLTPGASVCHVVDMEGYQ